MCDVINGRFYRDFRTRPIVDVQAKIELSKKQIVLEDNRTSMCDFADGTRHKW